MAKYRVIGLMSGTSLDGLDIAYCTFKHEKNKWHYSIKHAVTIKYDNAWLKKIKAAHGLSSQKLLLLHNEFGKYLGTCVKQFIKEHDINKIDLVASHGHTIFHQPDKHFTFQLWHVAAIAAECGLPVVSDFRSLDVLLGGQGAPLVPIGDKLLFPEYDFCLNLGGFANVSYQHKKERVAFDICPVNIALNYLAGLLNKEYDKSGAIAASGNVDSKLLAKLDSLSYYKLAFPKSLGREWLEEEFLPLLNGSKISVQDKLATVTEHIAVQIAKVLKGKGKVLVTGGGAFNTYLIKRIGSKTNVKLILTDKILINYKEALVFALLGVLRWRGEVNCLKSVTGAKRNNSGGSIYLAG